MIGDKVKPSEDARSLSLYRTKPQKRPIYNSLDFRINRQRCIHHHPYQIRPKKAKDVTTPSSGTKHKTKRPRWAGYPVQPARAVKKHIDHLHPIRPHESFYHPIKSSGCICMSLAYNKSSVPLATLCSMAARIADSEKTGPRPSQRAQFLRRSLTSPMLTMPFLNRS